MTAEGWGPVEGAEVQLRNPATGDAFTAFSETGGRYFLDNVPPGGPYIITASTPGFQPASRGDIQLRLGQRFTLDLQMRLEASEVIVIEEHLDVLDDHSRTGASSTVTDAMIARLPLLTRNFTDLMTTSPMISGSSFAGQNNRYNNIQIDGGANNDLFGLAANGTPGGQANATPLSVEAIDQFVLQVSPFDVRQGNFSGGLVNAITKNGTNDFHGAVFGYYLDNNLAGYGQDVPFLDYYTVQYGGVLGGPIIKDKVHFFAAVDFAQRQLPFGTRFDLTGDPGIDLAQTGFTQADVDRVKAALAGYGLTNPGESAAGNQQNPGYNIFVKVTTNVIENSHLELSYNWVNASSDVLVHAPTNVSVPTALTGSFNNLRDGYELSNSGYKQANDTNTARAKLTSTWLEGKLSNELLTGASFVRDHRDIINRVPLILVNARTVSNPSFIAAGGERFSQDNLLNQDIYEVTDNLTMSLPGHNRFTVGSSNQIFTFHNEFLPGALGVWEFNSIADLEMMRPNAYVHTFGVDPTQQAGTADFTVFQLGAYLQDEWQPIKNLTITPGFRIDVPFLPVANTNPNLINNTQFPIDTSVIPTGNPLYSPRLGFNWDVQGNSDTIVRGGGGIFSGRPPYVWVSNAYVNNGRAQFELDCLRASGGIPAFTIDPDNQPTTCSGVPGPLPVNQGTINFFDPNIVYPQNMRLALGVDRRLPFGVIGTFDFLYTSDVNGWYLTDENLMDVGINSEGRELYGNFTGSSATAFRANPLRYDPTHLRQALKMFNKDGPRVINATFQLQKQFSKRVEASAAYTYTDSKDFMSLTSSIAASNFGFAPIDGTMQERSLAPSNFDRSHKITLSGWADLPAGFGVGLTYILQSGLPYTFVTQGDVNADGVSGNDLVFVPANASQISLRDPTQWQKLDDFISNQECLQANRGGFVGRGQCRNPWSSFMNVRFSWLSPAVAGQRIQVQLDIFNFLNLINPDWGHLESATGFETFGQSFLQAVGYDTARNRPIYNFTDVTNPDPVTGEQRTPINALSYTSQAQYWRIQLGARYTF